MAKGTKERKSPTSGSVETSASPEEHKGCGTEAPPEPEVKNYIVIDFLYECIDCNPNGDPADENKPRMDGRIVTPSKERIKKTAKMGMEWLGFIGGFIGDKTNNNLWVTGEAVTAEKRLQQLNIDINKDTSCCILRQLTRMCIDARLFGATVAAGKGSEKQKGEGEKQKGEGEKQKGSSEINFIGPLQVKDARSVNEVDYIYKMVNAAFASSEGSGQRSFGHQYKIPYALIHTTAVYNPVVAEWNYKRTIGRESNCVYAPSAEDICKFILGLWWGTQHLATTSKFMHRPVLMVIRVIPKDNPGDILKFSLELYKKLREKFGENKSVRAGDVNFDFEEQFPLASRLEDMKNLLMGKDEVGKVGVIYFGKNGELKFCTLGGISADAISSVIQVGES